MRIALFGSPGFALPVLTALDDSHELALVVTQPDKTAGRGMKLTPPPVAARARELGLRLLQPPRLRRNEAFLDEMRALELDVAVTAAYGKILPQTLLDIPKHGFLNVHASLLPKYRGAAPIQWALIHGEQETGVSIMQTEAGLDTGPVRLVRKTPIGPDETALELFERLSSLGAEAIHEALTRLAAGTLPLTAQDDSRATLAPLLRKEDGLVRWGDPAQAIYHRYRGVVVWPGTHTVHRGETLKIHALTPLTKPHRNPPGRVLAITADGVTVAAGEGAVQLEMVQRPGKPRTPARDWANGYGVVQGDCLG